MVLVLLRRLASTALVVLGVAVLVFLLIHFIPGDPVDVMLGESAQPADRAALRQSLGLDQPIHMQLLNYFNGLIHLDLGRSLHSQRPILDLLAERLPATVELALAALAVMFGSGLIAWALARLLGEQPKTFVPPMMFVNAGNMGLPLMVLAFGESALPAAVVLFFVENTLHYVLGTWLLDHHARLWNLWRVPVIFAALAAVAVKLAGNDVWPPLHMAIKLLGDVSIPLLLFSLGVRLATSKLADLRIGLIGAVACPAMGMALAWAIGRSLELAPADADMLLVFGALPPAVLNFVFAERYRQEPAKVASMVMIGNLGALVFVPLALMLVLK